MVVVQGSTEGGWRRWLRKEECVWLEEKEECEEVGDIRLEYGRVRLKFAQEGAHGVTGKGSGYEGYS